MIASVRSAHSRVTVTTALCVVALTCQEARADADGVRGDTLTVHGRLTLCNGTPSYRIWIVGTKRMLGIRQSQDEVPDVPAKLGELMSADRAVFADFVVEPLAPYVPGVMQRVRVVSASKIVVTEQGKVVVMKARL